MATASLPPIEVTNHPPSHNASVDSILTDCGPFVGMATSARSHDRSGAKSATANRTSGCIPIIYSPSRRSASLARQQPHHEIRGNKNVTDHGPAGCLGSDIDPTRMEPGGRVNAVPNISGQGQSASSRVFSQHEIVDPNTRSSTSVDMARTTEARKSHTSSVSNASKESGGRKILNFLQRGFNPRRPKSVTKMEHRKSSSKCPHADSDGVCDQRPDEPMVTDPMEAMRLLDRQISLPKDLIRAFRWDPFAWPDAMLSRVSDNPMAQIRPVDDSLVGAKCRHCFQIVSQNIRTRVIQCNNNQNIYNDHESIDTNVKYAENRNLDSGQKNSIVMVPSRSADCLRSPGFHDEISDTIRTYSCPSATERSRWICYLRRLVHPGLDTERRRENCLHIWIQEAKGLTDKHRYHCDIRLDGVTYARTTSKRLTDMLFWGEEFDLSGLPEFENLCVQLWQDSNHPIAETVETHRPQTNSPPVSRSATSAPSPHTRSSHSSSTLNANLIQSPTSNRKTGAMMMSCARGSTELFGPDECESSDKQGLSSRDITGDRADSTGTVSHVLRERSDNVATNPRPAGSSKSAPVRRRAARRGKLKHHKHCTEAQLIAFVSIPAAKMNGTTEVECWYPATMCDSYGRPKHSTDSNQGSNGQGKTKGSHKNGSVGTQTTANGITLNSTIQLRIKTRHRSVLVLPLISYSCLRHHLAQFRNPTSQDSSGSLNTADSADTFDASLFLSSLDPWLSVKAKAELAGSIVAFQQAIGQAPQFLIVLILHEVHKQADPNMVLRGNSIATKATEIYLRLVGESYLSRVLSDFVRTVLTGCTAASSGHNTHRTAEQSHTGKMLKQTRVGGTSNISNSNNSGTVGVGGGAGGTVVTGCSTSFPDCEVDAAKLQSSSQLAQNQAHLKHLVEVVWERIVSSEAYFPEKLRTIFSAVRAQLDSAYPPCVSKLSDPQQATLSEHVISACLFLRYLCPAILSPSLFGLTAEFPSEPRVLRAFTLVAKTIQSLANFSLFAGSKEVYMTFMNPFVSSQLPAMRRFLYAISSPPVRVHRSITETESFVQSGQHFNGVASLTQSICLPPPSSGSSRALLTSHSHHGAFLDDSNPSNRDLFSDTTPLARSIAGLPIGDEPNRPISRNEKEGRSSPVEYSDPGGTSRIPILLPQLPPLDTDSQTGNHMDLALCLALCHLQLSEAMPKIPAEKASSHVAKIKPVLEEIDFFMKSGIEPSSSWWPQDFTRSNQQTGSFQAPVQPTSPTSLINSIPSTTTASISFRMKQSRSETLTQTDWTASEQRPRNSPPVQNNDCCDRQPQNDSRSGTIRNQSNVTPRDSPRPCVASLDLPQSANQKAFVAFSRGSSASVSHVVRSRSGSELTRSGSEGSHRVRGQVPSVLKEDHSMHIRTIIADNVKKPYPNEFPSYEEIPPPPPYALFGMEQQSIVRPVDVTTPREPINSKITDDSILWTMDRDVRLPTTVTGTVLSTNAEPNRIVTLINSDGVVSHENQTHSAHMYATHSSSSGYQSLRSHDTTAGGILNVPYGFSYECQDSSADKDTGSSARRSSKPCSALAMSNPLYAFHEPRLTAISPPTLCSLDESGLSPQDPRSPPPAQATPMRVKTATPRSARRHTYVNLANGSEAEAVFGLVRAPRRRASVTSDPVVARVSSPHNTSSSDRYSFATDRSTTPAGCGGSLVTLSSVSVNPTDTLETRTSASIRAHSTHRPNSTDADITRQIITMCPIVDGLDLGIPRRNGSLKSSAVIEKRIASFQTESVPLDPESIRDELDASQARLAEAQARLLANEAERIQLLRAWHNELMKQSRLVTYGSHGSSVNSPKRPLDAETFTIPRVPINAEQSAGLTVAHRRDTMPLTTDSSDPVILDYSAVSSNPTHSLCRTYSRPTYGTRPRMGASLIGAGYLEMSGSQIPPAESNQNTIPQNRIPVAWINAPVPGPVTTPVSTAAVGSPSVAVVSDNSCHLTKSSSDTIADASRNESVTCGWDQSDTERRTTSD